MIQLLFQQAWAEVLLRFKIGHFVARIALLDGEEEAIAHHVSLLDGALPGEQVFEI